MDHPTTAQLADTLSQMDPTNPQPYMKLAQRLAGAPGFEIPPARKKGSNKVRPDKDLDAEASSSADLSHLTPTERMRLSNREASRRHRTRTRNQAVVMRKINTDLSKENKELRHHIEKLRYTIERMREREGRHKHHRRTHESESGE